ncbi:MAG TPA: 3-oxoacyl-[acyl-carrier-protein] reductase [candidate division WOR-3 bacterium]|uniref:3-oxoacyl-[acyl-carrier-protein] reductase n=1 Tax=candidate division WOR-3 bacterium TaxID=2052148 RepID=A0A7C0VCW7_UNCW3|nr:3-oxoacyl-[acyl-carrier-protein] reductase [candidate division WOR-3 bacterium]
MLEGRVSIITGGARGIGKAIAMELADAGSDIVIFDVLDEGVDTAREIEKKGRKAGFYKVDITDLDAVNSVVEKVLKEFGRIDILVNNAGITRDTLLMRMEESDFDLVIKVNLKGTFNCTKAVLKPMMKARWGRIINISSIIGLMGNAGQANYAASKAGIIGFTKSVAKELGKRNITVNAIAPGFIRTPMTEKLSDEVKESYFKLIPLGRFGEPEDVAKVVRFLASDDAGYITGQVIQVDGGLLM